MTEPPYIIPGVVLAESVDEPLPDEDLYWVVLARSPDGRCHIAPADLELSITTGDVRISRQPSELLPDHVFGVSVRLRLALVAPSGWVEEARRRAFGTLAPAALRALHDWSRVGVARGESPPPVEAIVDEREDRYVMRVQPDDDGFEMRQRTSALLDYIERRDSGLDEAEDFDDAMERVVHPIELAAADAGELLQHAVVQEAFYAEIALPGMSHATLFRQRKKGARHNFDGPSEEVARARALSGRRSCAWHLSSALAPRRPTLSRSTRTRLRCWRRTTRCNRTTS